MNSDTPHPGPEAGPAWTRLVAGTRVVVRRRLTAAESADALSQRRGAVWTDVIGVVVAASDDGLRMRTDPRPGRGEPRQVWIPAALVTSVKPLPPRRARRP